MAFNQRSIQNPSANRQTEKQLSKWPASAARISCAKEQPTRCLLHADWMMLSKALLQMPHVGGETGTYSRRWFIYWLDVMNMSLSPLPHEAFVTGLCSASSNQHGANSVMVAPWHTKSVRRILVTSKAAFLKNYLAFSAWVLNGSLIECHKKKCQPFSLSGVWFESWAILISGWKSAWRWSSRKWAFHPYLLLIMCSNSQRETHQIAQIRHFEPWKRQYTTTEVSNLRLFWALT